MYYALYKSPTLLYFKIREKKEEEEDGKEEEGEEEEEEEEEWEKKHKEIDKRNWEKKGGKKKKFMKTRKNRKEIAEKQEPVTSHFVILSPFKNAKLKGSRLISRLSFPFGITNWQFATFIAITMQTLRSSTTSSAICDPANPQL